MKKLSKAVIALVVVVAVVIVAINIFNGGNKNVKAYNNVITLNDEIKKGDTNVVEAVDGTVAEMLDIITTNNLQMPDEKEFLTNYSYALSVYSVLNDEIIEYGIHTNKNNNGKYVGAMDKALKKLKGLYVKGYSYLDETYNKLNGQYEHIETVQDYIKNFVHEFSGALIQLNNFYYNAGCVLAYGTKNLLKFNNLSKLYVVYFTEVAHQYFEKCNEIENKDAYTTVLGTFNNIMNMNMLNRYLENKDIFDELYDGRGLLKLNELVNACIHNEQNIYIQSVTNEKQKSLQEKYVQYVVEG